MLVSRDREVRRVMLNPYLRQGVFARIPAWQVTFWSRNYVNEPKGPGLLIQGGFRGNDRVGDLFHSQATVHSSPLNP